jgi:hypothetical protein
MEFNERMNHLRNDLKEIKRIKGNELFKVNIDISIADFRNKEIAGNTEKFLKDLVSCSHQIYIGEVETTAYIKDNCIVEIYADKEYKIKTSADIKNLKTKLFGRYNKLVKALKSFESCKTVITLTKNGKTYNIVKVPIAFHLGEFQHVLKLHNPNPTHPLTDQIEREITEFQRMFEQKKDLYFTKMSEALNEVVNDTYDAIHNKRETNLLNSFKESLCDMIKSLKEEVVIPESLKEFCVWSD